MDHQFDESYPFVYIGHVWPWYKAGGWMEPLHRVFDMLKYFETILPLVESLWSS